MCPDPGRPENGGQVGDYEYPTSEDTEVMFECDPGYSLHNPTTDECEEEWSTVCKNGDWTQPLPVCRLECDDPGKPSNGSQIGQPVYPVCSGTEISFGCDDNFSLYDPESRVCLDEYSTVCNNGVWTEDTPTCQIMCGDPGTPENGKLRNIPLFPVCEGTVLEYECDSMYELIGSDKLVCEYGEWVGEFPECRIMCPDPGRPENGGQVGDYEYPTSEDTEVIFECDPGYSLHNPTTDECEEEWSTVCKNGNWTQPLPVCRLECDDPENPSDGYQIGEPVYPVCSGTEISFGCDDNFSLYDPESRVCLDEYSTVCNNGVWTEDTPTCQIMCGDPGTPENGKLRNIPLFPVCEGTVLEYECDSMYELIGSDKLVCEYGEWVGEFPECRIMCPDPGRPENGGQVGDYEYPTSEDTEVMFECDPGYSLHNPTTDECEEEWSTVCKNGDWTQPLPVCRLECHDPGNPSDGYQIGDPVYPVCSGTEIEFECDEGYSLYDEESNACLDNYQSNCENGDWTEPLPICQPMCTDQGTPENGKKKSTKVYPVCEGTVMEYECNEMYELIGSNSSTCRSGHWTNPLPECRIMCDDPGSPQYGGQIGDPVYPISNGTVVEFYCISTYDLIDPSDATCLESYHTVCVDGEWTHDLPLCEAECVDPGTPSDGSQVGAFEYPVCSGTCVPYTCDEGHELHGEEIICCDDGDWSSPIPSCNPTCEDPGHPHHGRQVGDHDYPVSEGYVVEFQCDDSYVLFNNGTKECIASSKTTCHNGTWTDPLPLCKQPCDDPGTPSDGFQTTENTYPVCTATIVGYECDEGFEMIGFHSTICHDSDWMIDMPFCRPLCNDPGTPENGHQIDPPEEYPVSEEKEIEFACDPGYSLHNPTTDECEEEWSTVCENGNWTQPLPVCRLECDDPGTPSDGYQIGEPVYPVCSGTEIAFECDENFSLYDPESRVCLNESSRVCNNGVWSEDPPTCQIMCGHPGIPDNGGLKIIPSFPVCEGTVLEYECDSMYELIGSDKLVCKNGEWVGEFPECRIMCPDPGRPENGGQVGDYEYPTSEDTEVMFECDPGYSLHNPTTDEFKL
ncbi:complement receptor type 1-like [Ptychodera flava]|uniref:complement receptor type 1-like n=1 Tax=Ptychodera flava TaxID=63121 RepID=UPI00396A51A8